MVFDPEFLYIQSGSVKCLNPAAGTAPAAVAEEKHFGQARNPPGGWEDVVPLGLQGSFERTSFRTETIPKPMVSRNFYNIFNMTQ